MRKLHVNVKALVMRGGSGPNGIHGYLSRAECGHRFNLQTEAKLERERLEARGIPTEFVASFKRERGTIFHELAQQFHLGNLEPAHDIIYDYSDIHSATLQKSCEDAERVFKLYTQFVEPTTWGDVLAVEFALNSAHCAGVGLGGLPLTGSVDMVVELKPPHCAYLAETYFVYPDPGLYILDFKTIAARKKTLAMEYAMSPQFMGYQHLYERRRAKPFDAPLKGALVVAVACLKGFDETNILVNHVDIPREKDIKTLKNFMAHAKKSEEADECNLSACIKFGVCPFYENNKCRRC